MVLAIILIVVAVGIVLLPLAIFLIYKVADKKDKEEKQRRIEEAKVTPKDPYEVVKRRMGFLAAYPKIIKEQEEVKRAILEKLNNCKDEEERLRLQKEYDDQILGDEEFEDYIQLRARTRKSWRWSGDEELYNECMLLINNEQFITLMKNAQNWLDFWAGNIEVSDKAGAKQLGRKGNEIAIWDKKFNGKIVSIDDVQYYQIDTISSDIVIGGNSGSKPSKLGTAINEALWGTAAATASAMHKMNQNAPRVAHSEFKSAKIYFSYETGMEPLYTDQIDKLKALMPEKQK